METKRLCPSCQKPLAPNVPMGLCPECLIRAGFPTGVETDTGSAKQPAFVPPTVEEIAKLFPQLEILELVGKGGMGAVYKARQKQLNRFVALKILPPGIGSEPAFAERFTREAQALAQLNHPNIVTLYEFGETSGQFYFLMEFVDGVNLRQLLHAGRIAPREALAIVPQICDALQFAHDQGIVHRDIKPENILLDRRGRVKVADFGLAKLVGAGNEPAGGGGTAAGSPELTESGKIMGTPNYMAPEQVEHPNEVDNRADIYALGVVFYQMLTGELPGKKIEPPSSKVQIDVRLDAVVLRALEKTPELRYQQVSEVKTMVETIIGDAGLPPAEPAARPVSPGKNLSAPSNNTTRTQHFMKKSMVVGLLIIIGIALVFLPALLYWHIVRPWQHIVNLDYYYQTRIASASPHDRDRNNNLAQLPAGHRIFDGVRFNVAGTINLACGNDVTQTNDSYPYPISVEGIPVNRFCHQLHLLHGTTGATDDQTVVAKLVLHYGDGTTADLNLIYGEQVYDWWFKEDDNPPLAGNTKIAWIGENPTSKRLGYRIRVFKTSFINPKPDVRIETVDYVSALVSSSPFLVALTTDDHSLASKAVAVPETREKLNPSSTVTSPAGPVELKGKAPAGPADTRLESKVKFTSEQASVQDIVQSLAKQVSLRYDWQKSFAQTDPLCRQWVRNVAIEGKTCKEALEQILEPVGLRYQVEKGVLVLSRQAKAIEITPNDAGSYRRRGDAKQDKNDLEGAIADYTKALELAPDDEGAYHRRGDAKQGKNDWDGAIADYTKALELKPDDAGAYFNRSLAKKAKGDLEGASADHSKAIELQPDLESH